MIVIPMAGASSRFTSAGYDVPKYMLPLDGRPLFDWSVLSFKKYFDRDSFLFICRGICETDDFVNNRASTLGIRDYDVVVLESETQGQADTVSLGLSKSVGNDSGELVIFNIDTIRPNFQKELLPVADGWLETFSAPGDGWSFVDVDRDDQHRVVRTTEKVRISDFCCTGLYGFSSKALFSRALLAERQARQSHELYIAPIFNHLISSGNVVRRYGIDREDVVFSGVPEEYEALRSAPDTVREKFHFV